MGLCSGEVRIALSLQLLRNGAWVRLERLMLLLYMMPRSAYLSLPLAGKATCCRTLLQQSSPRRIGSKIKPSRAANNGHDGRGGKRGEPYDEGGGQGVPPHPEGGMNEDYEGSPSARSINEIFFFFSPRLSESASADEGGIYDI